MLNEYFERMVDCISQQGGMLDIHEEDQLDEAQFASWVKQASQLPGERM